MSSYLRPTRLDDALDALGAMPRTVLAGGTDVYPAHVGTVIDDDILDITALAEPDLRAIELDAGRWRIGALVTWTDLVHRDLPPSMDGLKAAARSIGGVQIQNRGTICGNVCNASPAADGLPNLIALDATVEVASAAGRREVPVAAFMTGNRRTVRRPDELVTAVLIPAPASEARSSFRKLGSRAYLVISIAMVAVVIELGGDGRIANAGVVVGACSEIPQRLAGVESRLVGELPTPALASAVVPGDLDALAPIDDVRATASYRRDAALVLVRRAIQDVTR
jgi:CO/xanthine dehydrogenase FAD-binding subunit